MFKFILFILLFSNKLLAQSNFVSSNAEIAKQFKKPTKTKNVNPQSIITDTKTVSKPAPNMKAFNSYKPVLGWFCYREIEIQKALKLPIFFRLGSKNYVDYLEGKNK